MGREANDSNLQCIREVMSTQIFLTSTTLDASKQNALVLAHLLKTPKKDVAPDQIWNYWNNDFLSKMQEAEADYKKGLENHTILLPTVQKKEEYRKYFLDIYTHYPEPTFLLLGDLSSIDEAAQEGMLKILEEPPYNLTIILFSKNSVEIKPTIISRSVITQIPKNLIVQLLPSELVEQVRKVLPDYKQTVNDILNLRQENVRGIDLKKVERRDLDFWFWQMLYFVGSMGEQNKLEISKITLLQQTLLIAQQYNRQNLQKKFIIESLFL